MLHANSACWAGISTVGFTIRFETECQYCMDTFIILLFSPCCKRQRGWLCDTYSTINHAKEFPAAFIQSCSHKSLPTSHLLWFLIPPYLIQQPSPWTVHQTGIWQRLESEHSLSRSVLQSVFNDLLKDKNHSIVRRIFNYPQVHLAHNKKSIFCGVACLEF